MILDFRIGNVTGSYSRKGTKNCSVALRKKEKKKKRAIALYGITNLFDLPLITVFVSVSLLSQTSVSIKSNMTYTAYKDIYFQTLKCDRQTEKKKKSTNKKKII